VTVSWPRAQRGFAEWRAAKPFARRAAAVVLAAAVSVGGVSAQSGNVAVEASPEQPQAGEGFQLIVTCVSQAETSGNVLRIEGSPRVFWPDLASIGLQQAPGDRSSTRISSVNGRMVTVTQQSIVLIAAQPGYYVIPPIRADLGNVPMTTATLTVEVVSASSEDAAGVRARPMRRRWVLPAVVAGIAAFGILVVAVVIGRRMGGRAMPDGHVDDGAAHTTARAIARLERLAEQGDARPFYHSLSAIVREQLGGMVDRDTSRMTTGELLAACRERACDPQWLAAIEECLTTADRVRFGAGVATCADSARHLGLARTLVAASRRRGHAPLA